MCFIDIPLYFEDLVWSILPRLMQNTVFFLYILQHVLTVFNLFFFCKCTQSADRTKENDVDHDDDHDDDHEDHDHDHDHNHDHDHDHEGNDHGEDDDDDEGQDDRASLLGDRVKGAMAGVDGAN